MSNPDVAAYLRANMRKFPLDDLRRQLAAEGVSDSDFDQALEAARRAPAPEAGSRKAGLFFLLVGVVAVAAIGLIVLGARQPAPPAASQASADESAFIGHYGYVVRLPKEYRAIQAFKDQEREIEVVHFCKKDLDPSNLVNEGLFGPLGVVRLEARPDSLTGNLQGLDLLSRVVTAGLERRKEKFRIKNIQVSALRGFEVTVDAPFPRIETHILGKKIRYFFLAGQDDQTYRDILMSLRETQSEG